MNETKSGFLTIWVKDNKLDKLKIWPSPVGSMTPIPDLKPDQKMLKDFIGSTICVRRIGMTFTRW